MKKPVFERQANKGEDQLTMCTVIIKCVSALDPNIGDNQSRKEPANYTFLTHLLFFFWLHILAGGLDLTLILNAKDCFQNHHGIMSLTNLHLLIFERTYTEKHRSMNLFLNTSTECNDNFE